MTEICKPVTCSSQNERSEAANERSEGEIERSKESERAPRRPSEARTGLPYDWWHYL